MVFIEKHNWSFLGVNKNEIWVSWGMPYHEKMTNLHICVADIDAGEGLDLDLPADDLQFGDCEVVRVLTLAEKGVLSSGGGYEETFVEGCQDEISLEGVEMWVLGKQDGVVEVVPVG